MVEQGKYLHEEESTKNDYMPFFVLSMVTVLVALLVLLCGVMLKMYRGEGIESFVVCASIIGGIAVVFWQIGVWAYRHRTTGTDMD